MGVAASMSAAEAMSRHHASEESLVVGPAQRPAEDMVVFYRLGRKFVDDERSIPKEGTREEDIVYYTLAVGHHTGVIDCFDECLSCSVTCYRSICELMPEGHARYKMEGILRSGEIQILHENVPELLAAADAAQEAASDAAQRVWLDGFKSVLKAMAGNKAIYMMGRERRS
ncbi:MAG: hypothetical protein E7002_08860 [Denitrobacterium detoxificans]|nr:hypothetical protein [Denitrobacterium detoxificans]